MNFRIIWRAFFGMIWRMGVAGWFAAALSFSEGGRAECRGPASLAACRAAYREVLPILRRAAASRTFSPLAMWSRARRNLSAATTGLRPPFRPRAAAAASPALVRSRMRSRSNGTSAPYARKTSRPPEAVVSMLPDRDRNPTPRASSAPMVSTGCGRGRPRRSSRQTARTADQRSFGGQDDARPRGGAPSPFGFSRHFARRAANTEWVDGFNHRRLLEPIGHIPPAELEAAYDRQQCD